MRKALTVMVILSAVIFISFSSANATCKMAAFGKITGIVQSGPSAYTIIALQNTGTNLFWGGTMSASNPALPLLGSAMAAGISVHLMGDAAACPAPTPFSPGTRVWMGNITSVQLTK